MEYVYSQSSGPGGLKLAEFIADKMKIKPNSLLLDIGIEKGIQTCFLAKEYNTFVVGIDPDMDRRESDKSHVDFLMVNRKIFGVENQVLGIKIGIPDTPFPDNCFDYIYSTTTLEMIRGLHGCHEYNRAINEIHRILKPNGIFGCGEPMHKKVLIPGEIKSFVTSGDLSWENCFKTIDETENAIKVANFKIIESGHAEDSQIWWEEYAQHDPYCQNENSEEKAAILTDKGRWLSFGYIIAQK